MKTLVAAAEPDPRRRPDPTPSATNMTVIVSSFEDYPVTATTIAWTTEFLEPWAAAEW